MTATLASYLANLSPHSSIGLPNLSALDDGTSSKRPRSYSPDTSTTSSQGDFSDAGHHYFAASLTHVTLHPNLRPCLTASLLSSPSLGTSPCSSPPLSRPLSRRSSTGASCKAVRFARCTNASVFPALSSMEYDRTPIVPTCADESLELPKRKQGEEEGWIKCVERERAAAAKAKEAGQTLPCLVGRSHTTTGIPSPAVENPVEGVHGLIEGGYFVGEERDEAMSSPASKDMVIDDSEDGETEAGAPSLIQDDSSGDDDSDGVLSITTEPTLMITGGSHISMSPVERSPSPSASRPQFESSPISGGESLLAFNSVDRHNVEVDVDHSDEADGGENHEASVTETENDTATEEAERIQQQQEKKKKCKDRYGICALGKYTRAEVFQSYDSLGGF